MRLTIEPKRRIYIYIYYGRTNYGLFERGGKGRRKKKKKKKKKDNVIDIIVKQAGTARQATIISSCTS